MVVRIGNENFQPEVVGQLGDPPKCPVDGCYEMISKADVTKHIVERHAENFNISNSNNLIKRFIYGMFR